MVRCRPVVKELRKSKRWTQREIADLACIGLRTYTKVESGREVEYETIEAVASVLEVDPDELCEHDARDAVVEGPFSLHRFIRASVTPAEDAYCFDGQDAINSAVLMRKYWTLHVERCATDKGNEVYQDGCQTLLDGDFESYKQRYLDIWEANPRTILYAMYQGVRCGQMMILPVTNEAYYRLREGEISYLEIGPEDLCDQSQKIVIDSGVEFSGVVDLPWYRLTEPLQFAMFYQLASLSLDAMAGDFGILSFGASSLNVKRLVGSGFRELPTRMPVFGFPIYEFGTGQSHPDPLARSTYSHYANQMQQALRPSFGTELRERLMRRSIWAYQKVLRQFQVSPVDRVA